MMDRASHLDGVDQQKNTTASMAQEEAEMKFIAEDKRFDEVLTMLRTAKPYRNNRVTANKKIHRFRVKKAGREGGATALAPVPAASKRKSMASMFLGLEEEAEAAASSPETWLTDLDEAVSQMAFGDMPALCDIITYKLMRAYNAADINLESQFSDVVKKQNTEKKQQRYHHTTPQK